ncbi:MAG: outer membrane beta-barrel protein [Hyphomicrobium sp.]
MSHTCRRLRPSRFAAALLLPASLTVSGPAHAGLLAPIWTGMYAGVHGGANWIDIDRSSGSSVTLDAATVGGHLGLNLGLGLVVVGVEADLGIALATSEFEVPATGFTHVGRLNAFGTARARLGIPIGPALFYATAGYAWSDFEITSIPSSAGAARSTAFTGIVYGVGAEVMVLPSISVRLEALHYDFGQTHLDFGALGRTVETFDPSATVVRAGVSFRFN